MSRHLFFGLTLGLLPLGGLAEPPAQAAQQSGSSSILRTGSPIHKGATEWGWRSGGGTGLAGGVRGGNFWALHLRWGRVLSSAHGWGPLRGNLEYAFELVPAMLIRQTSTVYGGGFNPLIFQYNFTSDENWVPFVQIGGGLLFTTEQVPAGTSRFNFTPQGGVGAYWFLRERTAFVFGVRYHHISNGSTAERNPGRNSLFLNAGLSWWR